MIYFPNLKKI